MLIESAYCYVAIHHVTFGP